LACQLELEGYAAAKRNEIDVGSDAACLRKRLGLVESGQWALLITGRFIYLRPQQVKCRADARLRAPNGSLLRQTDAHLWDSARRWVRPRRVSGDSIRWAAKGRAPGRLPVTGNSSWPSGR